MADTDSNIKPPKPASEVPSNQANPSPFFTHFLNKAVIVTIFLLVLPLFPSQAPEFINQTRSWELIQLLFVGIAVSYGLFSKRNDETEKEYGSKFDNAQSYVSGLLEVSSVFDEETESPTGFDDNKVQTWNSQYYRDEPVVVVAQESSVLEEQRGGTSFRTVEKPLLLPVRSLKSRFPESDIMDSTNESIVKTGSLSRSSLNSGSRRFPNNSNKTRNGEFGGPNILNVEEKVEENVVLRSPIPWRSRSGRMEMKVDLDLDLDGPPLYSLPPSMEESEFSASFRSQTSRSSRPNSTSPSLSLSSESQAKNAEDLVRKKINKKFSPPPPPPPPPLPPFARKTHLMKSNSSVTNDEIFAEKELLRRSNSGLESRTRTQNDGSFLGKSFRTVKVVNDSVSGAMRGRGEFNEEKKRSKEEIFVEKNEFFENMVMETEEDSESEYDDFEVSSDNEEVASNSVVGDGGPDVNKKADEFIAKFREQIRLQRIESIKRSSGQIARKSLR
uniref:Putative formin BNI1-like n=1 Tax=Davidia involucrata TaxID=16924 RepID=A0A5B6ZRK7_DAVIN